MENIVPYNSVLTIAGSDSGGCAGIQADIKSISACGAFAASVITATTAQNTQGVFDIHAIPIHHLEQQLDAVLSDIEFQAIKIGMLHSCEVIRAVKSKLISYAAKNIVLDPVMVATSGDRLLSDNALDCLMEFLSSARLITPNIPEAALLLGNKIEVTTMEKSAQAIAEKFQTSVLLKGGHLASQNNMMIDILYLFDKKQSITITNPFVDSPHVHGTGCSLSSSIAAYLAQDFSLEEAVKKACSYVNKAIALGKNKRLGKGKGPINHFGL